MLSMFQCVHWNGLVSVLSASTVGHASIFQCAIYLYTNYALSTATLDRCS